MTICQPLIDLLSEQLYAEVLDPLDSFLQQREIKRSISGHKRNLNQERAKALYDILSPEYMRIVELASEKGASCWLTVLPIDSSGFALHKSGFRDALCLRYGWPCKDLPSQCKCGNQPSVDHLLSCPMGGYPSLRHNEIRDITASFLSEVCRDVSIEPRLQELSGELLTHRSANTTPNAILDVAADGVWGSRFERFFFDVRVFNPFAPSNSHGPLADTYRKHEADKRRLYGERVRDVEQATFIPVIFSTTGGMGKPAKSFYRRLASLLSEKNNISYSKCMELIRCKLTFALLRSSIVCIRGSRSSRPPPASFTSLELQYSEAQISSI